MSDEISPDDTVSVRDGDYEASVMAISDDGSHVALFAPIGTVGTPSGAVEEPIDEVKVVDDD